MSRAVPTRAADPARGTVPPRLETTFEDADLSPGLMLWRVTNAWQAAMRAALRPLDLTHVQFVLLATLVWLESDEPVTQRRIASHARTDAMMTSQVLRTLESKDLIERQPHPTDARARALVASPAGIELANRANRAVEAADAEFFRPLGARQSDLVTLLARLDRAA